MANSTIIGKIKNKIIKGLIKDKEIVAAIHSTEVTSPEKLVGTHIFNFHQIPDTIKLVGTFITIQVQIPQNMDRYANKAFVKPTLEVWIVSHESHMVVNNVPKITDNRNDYLSVLIDKKINGKSGYGIGELRLQSNIEGTYQKDYLYRKLVFEIVDLNASLCDEEY